MSLNPIVTLHSFCYELGLNDSHLLHLFGGERVLAGDVVAPPAGPDRAGGVAVTVAVVLLVARLVDGLVVVGKLLGTVPPAAVQLQGKKPRNVAFWAWQPLIHIIKLL